MDPVRIVSYNVRYFGHVAKGLASTRAGKRGIARTLASLRPIPDLVCLQEVETSSIRSNIGRPRTRQDETQLESFMGYLTEQFHEAGMEMPFEALYFRAHSYKLGEISLYTTGLAILVNRFTLRVDEHNADQPFGITYYRVAKWKDRKQSRICAHLKVRDLQGHAFHVFNTHLSLPTPFAREYWAIKDKMGWGHNQIQEVKRLASFIRERAGDEPFVVCGDFNSQPTSPVFEFMHRESGLVAPQVELGQIDLSRPRAFPTAGFLRLRMHLDHLFSNEKIRWTDLEGTVPFGADGPFDGLSDHVPLIGRFEVAVPRTYGIGFGDSRRAG
jgi:endonuclease/exonuclease/phosphatase family metal-dependent hydrolase